MTDIVLLIIGVAIVSFVTGWNAREYRAKVYLRGVEKRMQHTFSNMVQEAIKNTVEIEITRQGDMFYVYNKKTGEFLAQGVKHDDIADVLGKRFPEVTFVANPSDLEKVGYTK